MKVGKKALSLLLTVSMVFSFVPNSLTFATAKGSTENTYADSAYDSGGKKDSGIPGPSVPVTGIQLSKTNLTLEYGESETLTATVSPEEANDQEIFWITSSSKICTVDQNGKVTAKGNGTATITAITHDGGFTAECKVTVITSVTGVELDKTTMTLAKGTKEALTAIITPQSATQKGVLWSSSDQNVCTVDSSGNVTALNTGTAIVTATTKDGGLTAECTVTVVIPAYRVSLNKNELMLEKGKSEILTATVSPADATNKSIAWSCSNNEVCTVDQNGKVTAIATGTATITVKTIGGEFTAECKVTVVTPVTGIKLNKTSASLAKGGKETLTATVTPEDASQKEVIWSSSDENICTVDASGVVTAINEGTAVVLATTKDGRYTATCIITVTVPITGIALDKPELTLEKGQSESLTATISPADATNKSILWSTSDESVAYVDQDGKVTAMAAGTAIIKVTTRDGISAQCAVTVYNPVTSIKLSSSELTLAEGKNKTLTATIYPEDAANKTVTWSSSNEEVAYVTQAGKVIALSIGTATITATAKNGVSAQCAVTVVIPATSIKLSSSTLTLTQGKNETLTATVYPEDATDKTVTWSSSNEDIVYVTQSGKVIPLGVGNVIITATTKDGVSAQCAVTVIIPAESIKLSSSELTLAEGKSASVTATVYPEDAADKTITWSSSDEEVAYVTQFGKVIALSAGTATVTAATKNGVTAQCSVTVIISVTGIKLSSSELALTQGKSDTLTATVYPENATVKTVLWSSSNEDVAYVTQSGKVIALGVGTATITAATKDGNFTAEAAVTVKPNTYKVVAKAIHGFVRGTGTYNAGSKVTLTAVPDRHYHFINWVDETGNTIGTETTYEINELCADTTVSAVFAIDSVTVTATAGPNGTVSGSGEYQYGDTVTLTATPDEHYHFTGWSDGVTTATRTFTAEQNIEVTAAFAINTITVTATAGPNGTVSGGGEYQYGDTVTLTATPDEHYHFTGWSDGVTTATRTFTAEQNIEVTAAFAIDTITVTATAGPNGTVSGGSEYQYGDAVTLTATPDEHYHFTGWSDGMNAATRTFTAEQNIEVTATFAIDTITVTATAGPNGTVSGGGEYQYGDAVTLTATPDEHYHFTGWSDGVTTATRTFTAAQNVTLTARFSIDTFAVTATAGAGGSTTGGGTYEYGKTVTLTAVPSAHYHFTGWSDGITIESRSVTVTKDMAITASFAIDTFTVTVIAGEGGTVTGGGTYPYGTWITLNAIPYGGYKFVQWSDGYTNASRAFSLTSDTTYFAQFDKLYDATIQILGKHDTQCIIKDSVINPDGSGWLKMANYDTEWYRDLIGLDIKLDNPVLVSNNDYFWNAPNLSFSAEHANLQYCHSSGYYNDTLVFNDSYNGYHNYYGIAQIGSSPILTNHVRIWWDVKVSASSSYDGFYYISWPAGGLTVLGTTIKSPKILPIIYL